MVLFFRISIINSLLIFFKMITVDILILYINSSCENLDCSSATVFATASVWKKTEKQINPKVMNLL